MPLTWILSLDIAASADELRLELVARHGLTVSNWLTVDGTPWLTSEHGNILVEIPDIESRNPFNYPQNVTVRVTLYPTRYHDDTLTFLFRVASDVLGRHTGDAALEYDTGPTALLRRGDTVWVETDPWTRDHLLFGSFQPAKLIIGLP